jgi:ABC-type multidrug transport system ATPase subunit
MESPAKGTFDPILDVQDVRKRYGKYVALDNISLAIKKGAHLLVLGPNGAGKTTLIKSIMGLVNFEGRITIGGIDVKRDPRGAKELMGYVPQNYAFYEGLTVYDHARLSTRLKDVGPEEIQEKLEAVNLWHKKKSRVRALSHGMKQRLGIALAMIGDPPLLLLDEPTSNVDLRGQLEFQALLQELLKQGKTMLTTTHLTGLGELATDILIIDKGKIIAKGRASELLSSLRVTDTLYLRVSEGDSKKVVEFASGLGATGFTARGEWITASVPTMVKLDLVKKLMASSYAIEDMLIERSGIESEYLKLIGAAAPEPRN